MLRKSGFLIVSIFIIQLGTSVVFQSCSSECGGGRDEIFVLSNINPEPVRLLAPRSGIIQIEDLISLPFKLPYDSLAINLGNSI